MRISAKIAAAVAALALSAVAQAASWTGSASTVKFTYIPNNAGAGYHAIQLSGTGSSCTFPVAGTMVFQASTTADGDVVKALYDFLLHARATAANITIDYTPGGFCYINTWTRN